VLKKLSRLGIGILTWLSFLCTTLISGIFALVFYYGRDLPDHTSLASYEPILTNRFFLKDESIWRDYSKEKRFFTAYDAIPEQLIQAILVAEDKNFFNHPGIDLMGIVRALIQNTLLGRWQTRPMGASTITQQIAKNFLLGSERSLERKIKEAVLAVRLERTLSKERILELYLNQIYLGSGAHGVTSAAEIYFQKPLEKLTLDEMAFLAALPKAPGNYQPHKNPSVSKSRRDWVLDRLYEEGYITGQDLMTAKSKPIATMGKPPTKSFEGDYFAEAVRQDLIEKVGMDRYRQGGYFLHTTVVPQIQQLAHQCLQRGLEAYDRRYGYRGAILHFTIDDKMSKNKNFVDEAQELLSGYDIGTPPHMQIALVKEVTDGSAKLLLRGGQEGIIKFKDLSWARKQLPNRALGPEIQKCTDVLTPGDIIHAEPASEGYFKLAQIPEVTGAIIVMNKDTGEVHALSGGYDFAYNQFNNATQAKRQPGSSFKPFVYLAALEKGISKETQLLDAPLYIPLGFKTKDGKTAYTPRNFGNRYYGPTTLENALTFSRNVITVRLAMQIGMGPVAQVSQAYGLYEKLPRQFAMVLGAGETTLLKLTAAYAMLANGGKKITPTFFERIEDRRGKVVFQHEDHFKKDPHSGTITDLRPSLTNPQISDDIRNMLIQVVERGTGRKALLHIAQKHHISIGGKTGTSNDSKDTWFIGFGGDIVVGIFVGFSIPKSLGNSETGSTTAAPIAADFFDRYLTIFPVKHTSQPFPSAQIPSSLQHFS